MTTEFDANLKSFFDSFEDSLEKNFSKTGEEFFVKICGNIIRIWYQNHEQCETAKGGLKKFIVDKCDNYDVTFKYWEMDFSKYFPETFAKNGIHPCQSSVGRLRSVPGYFMSGCDYERKTYYYCVMPGQPFVGSHALVYPFYLWGMQNDLLLIHSACVGADGKGVLLAANGGGGKSTLSVSCLMHGLDFVSDDYTMIGYKDKLVGMPLYSNIGLTNKSYEMLQPKYEVNWINKDNDNKKFMDISKEPLCDELEIKAIVTPRITGGETSIKEVNPSPVLAALMRSSIDQTLAHGNKDYIFSFMKKLKGLKVYEISLGTDVNYNAEFLRNFIKGEL